MDGNLNNQNIGVDTTTDTSTTGTETKTYTQEEVNMLLQRESDRRVSEALKRQRRRTPKRLKKHKNLRR